MCDLVEVLFSFVKSEGNHKYYHRVVSFITYDGWKFSILSVYGLFDIISVSAWCSGLSSLGRLVMH